MLPNTYIHMYKELLLHSICIRTYNQLLEELPIIGDQGDLRAHTEKQ